MMSMQAIHAPTNHQLQFANPHLAILAMLNTTTAKPMTQNATKARRRVMARVFYHMKIAEDHLSANLSPVHQEVRWYLE